jgi:hypothetical protein
MSFDSDVHNLFGLSQSDPDAIDNIIDMCSSDAEVEFTQEDIDILLKEKPEKEK